MNWVFGYGSLLWNPGFPYTARKAALLRGYHRAYKIYSTRNRGTPERPGMVVSLAPGGQCTGMAYRIEPGRLEESLTYLDQREGVGRAHNRVVVPVHLLGDRPLGSRPPGNGAQNKDRLDPLHAFEAGPSLNVWTYLPIISYTNYITGVPLSRKAELIAHGAGKTGSAYDYLRLMLEELEHMGVREPDLQRLLAEARRLRDGPATMMSAK